MGVKVFLVEITSLHLTKSTENLETEHNFNYHEYEINAKGKRNFGYV